MTEKGQRETGKTREDRPDLRGSKATPEGVNDRPNPQGNKVALEGSTNDRPNPQGNETTPEGATNDRGALRLCLEIFWGFLKLGLLTIGGGYAMIPQMQQVAVEDHGWMTEEEVVDCIAVSQSLPGIIAINMATYIGRKLDGVRGAVCATVGVVLPSFVIISLAVLILDLIRDNPWVSGAFMGVKAAVCGLILVSAIRLGKQVLRTPLHWILMLGALALVGILGITAVWVILAGGVVGIVYAQVHRMTADVNLTKQAAVDTAQKAAEAAGAMPESGAAEGSSTDKPGRGAKR